MTITEFLEARITEDEVASTLRDCHKSDCETTPGEDGYSYPCNCGLPERMTAECAAKRTIMDEHKAWIYTDEEPGFSMVLWGCMCNRQTLKPCPTIAALAGIYDDHSDYQQEWK